ncbi:MAG: murein L,D-transpeptidase catalytic domain family protein, partial [Chitinophagaceae bacterium]|nr:murein L,D-transpeptidase catalytic domain family protein [Chitinophagaceae bacterium]
INGVDPGYNDKALERTIVIHGAAYVDPARAKAGVFMGRSWGCPAVPQKESATIIKTIKEGTCLFIYHPGKNYLLDSKILNG